MGEVEDDSWKKLPIEDKIQHKVWKARMEGYEELKKVFERADEKSTEFSKYQHYIKNLVSDANAFAQEKGLDSAFVFVQNANVAGKTAGDVIPLVVAKGLGGRPKAKDSSKEILLMYIEIEKQEIVIEELGKAFTHKTPKNVVAACQVIREGLNLFGNKVVGIKPLLKIFPPLFKHKDKAVREEAKLLAIEMYRWVNMVIKQALAAIPPLILKELEEEWAKLPNEPALPTRFLRSQQDYKAKVEAQAAALSGAAEGGAAGPAAAVETVDPYDFLDPVEILSKVSPDFLTQLEDKKWSIRKDALTEFKTLASAPKLEPGDFGEIVRQLKKIISKDANVMVVVVAAECTTLLASGLRKKFGTYATHVFSGILERFKEKKATVVEALRAAADAVIKTAKFESFLEDITEQLESKSPSVKSETMLVIARFAQKHAKQADFPKSITKQLLAIFIKRLAESAPEIREASFEAIASLWKLCGEKFVLPFLSDLDKLKMDKIKESYEKLAAAPAAAAKGDTAPAKPAAETKAPSSAPASKGDTKAKTAVKPGGAKPAAAGAKKKAAAPKEEVNERELDDGAVDNIREDKFSEEVRAKFDSNNWKERLEGCEEFKKVLMMMEPETIPCQAFVRILGTKNKFKETNFNVQKAKFSLIGEIARLGKFSKTSFMVCAAAMIDKIGDIKAGSDVKAALVEIAEKVGFPVVAEEVVNLAMEQKNPKNQSESFAWLADTMKLFGFKGVPVKLMVEKIKVCLSASNPAVRQNAVALTGVMFLYMGQSLHMLFETEKPAVVQMIDAEFAKLKDEKPPPVTRGVKASTGDAAGDAEDDAAAEEAEPEDVMPRTNISEKITEELLNKFADAKWKVREEGLTEVQQLIKEAAFVTPHLGELPTALNKMLADKNKILASTTATICTELSVALGPGCKQHVKTLAPGMLGLLTDGKPAVRQNAIKCMDAWVEKTKLAVFFEDEIILTALKSTNVFIRQELYGWLEKQMATSKVIPIADLMAIVPTLFTALEDRSGDVRKAAQGAVLLFMAHAGYEKVFRQTSKLSPTSQTAVSKILEAQRANIPDVKGQFKPPAPVATSAPAASKPAPKAAPAPVESDNDSDAGATKEPAKEAPKKLVKKPSAATKKPGSARGKPAEEEDLTPALSIGKGKESKEQRLKDEINHKVLKWNFNTPNKEHVQQLNDLMQTVCSPILHGLLFHADFKNHLTAMQTLTDLCNGDNRDVFVHNSDLLVKWASLRLFDTNTSVVFKVLDFLFVLFEVLNGDNFTLTDNEATAFLPYLISLRIGDPKDEIRKKVHNILKVLPNIYAGTKIFSHLMEGTKQKNARGRSECLEAMSVLIEYLGMPVCSPSQPKAIKDVAAIIGDKDASVRNSALSLLIQAINICGVDQIQKWIGTLPEKHQSMLDERVKRNVKKPVAAPTNADANTTGIVNMKEILEAKGIKRPATSAGARQPMAPPSGQDNEPQRPQTAANLQSHSSRIGNSCKNNRYFNIDFDEIEKGRTPMWDPPNFYTNPEVEAMIKEPLPSYTIKSSNYSNLSLLTSSTDATNTLGLALSSVTDIDVDKSKVSLLQIAELLRDEDKNVVFQKPDINKLVLSMTMQLRVCVTHHLQGAFDSEKLASLIRVLLDTMTVLFNSTSLAPQVSAEALLGLMHELINCAVDENFSRLPDLNQFQQSVNNVLFDILQNCDFTAVTCNCLKLLRSSVGANVTSTSQDIILKCLWKSLRLLPNHSEDLDYTKVLTECHLFLKDYPSKYWETQSKDTPSRTVKTLVHNLIKIRGDTILEFTSEIPDLSSSELLPYLKKVISRLSEKGGLTKVVNRTNEQIVDDLVKKFHDNSDPNNGKNACKLFINLKLKNPTLDTSKFLSIVDAPTARWIKNVLENPYYEKARNRFKNPQTVLTEPEAKPMEHYDKFLSNMKSTIQTWTQELHGVQETAASTTDQPNTDPQNDPSPEPSKENQEPVSAPRPKTAPAAEPLSSRPAQNFDTTSSLDTKDVQEFKRRLAMIKNRANPK